MTSSWDCHWSASKTIKNDNLENAKKTYNIGVVSIWENDDLGKWTNKFKDPDM